MKKILSVILVVLMCVGVCPISTLAANEEFVVTAEGGMALVGGKITVPVVVTKNSGWRALEIRVSYDADVLEIECPNHDDSSYCSEFSAPSITKKEDFEMPVKYASNNLGVTSPRHTANPYIFQWAYPTISEDITETGTYATITFKVKDEAALGETTVGLYIDVITNCNYEHPTTLTNDATVNVVDEFPVPVAPTTVKGKFSDGSERDIHANDDTTSVSVESFDALANEVKLSFSYDTTHEAYGDTVEWYKGDELVATGLTATVPYNTYNADDYRVVVEYENYLGAAGSFESYTTAGTYLTLETTTVNINGTDYKYHNGEPTGEMWGFYNRNAENKVPALDPNYPNISTNGAFASNGQSVAVHIANVSNSGNIVKAYHGKNMLRLNSAISTAVKAIEGLTPGKTYYVSLMLAAPSGTGVSCADVANNKLDTYYGSTTSNSSGHKILSFNRPEGKYTSTDGYCDWYKAVVYFKAENTTEYLKLCFSSSQSYVDNIVCKEVTDEFLGNEWDFEDGVVTPDGFATSVEKSTMGNLTSGANGTIAVKDTTDSDPAKLGNKYFELTAGTSSANYATANFYYNGTDRYILSFDMKMINFATATGSKLEMFLAKSNGTGHVTTSYTTANAAIAPDGQIVNRYWENGSAFFQSVNASSSSHYMFVTSATDSGVGFDELRGGKIWNEWAHWEIEIDPSKDNDYEGFISFGWHLNTSPVGAVLGIDNIKIERVSTDELNIAKDNFNSTYAFNIRSSSSGYKQGLRFKSSIDLDIVDNFGAGSKIVEYGTLAATKQAYDNGAALGKKLLRENAKDIATKKSYAIAGVAYNRNTGTDIRYSIDNETNVVTFTGVIVGMNISQFTDDFVVRGYVVVETADGIRTVVYGDIQTLNMYQAAAAVVANPLNDADKAAAQEVIDQWNAYKGIE